MYNTLKGLRVKPTLQFARYALSAALALLALLMGAHLFEYDHLLELSGAPNTSAHTLLMLAVLGIAVAIKPVLADRKISSALSMALCGYILTINALEKNSDIDMWIGSVINHQHDSWTDNGTYVSIFCLSLATTLLHTRYTTLGVALAFVTGSATIHLLPGYFYFDYYLENQMGPITATLILLFGTVILLRYAPVREIRSRLVRPQAFRYLVSMALLGLVIQLSIVAYDAYHNIFTTTLQLMAVALPFQYLLFRHALGSSVGITQLYRYADDMHLRATIDPLTRCGNRLSVEEHLDEFKKNGVRSVGVIILDIDLFKKVNDKYGHAAGDEVLKYLARLIRQNIRRTDLFIRWGGEEFLVIMPGGTLETTFSVAETLRHSVEQATFPAVGKITISLGVSQGDIISFDQRVSHADSALYQSKSAGRNQTTKATDEFISELHNQSISLSQRELEAALMNGEFYFVAQPVVDVVAKSFIGFEALLRWKTEDGSVRLPNMFIDKLNQLTAQNRDLYEFLVELRRKFIESLSTHFPEAYVSFNVALDEVETPAFRQSMAQMLDVAAVYERQVMLEISELSVTSSVDVSSVNETIERLQSSGVIFSLDDFGSESNSLQRLMQLNVSHVKLDRVVVNALSKEGRSLQVLASLVLMMHRLKINVVAVGVEDNLRSILLKNIGYKHQQGFFHCEPQLLAQFLDDLPPNA